ncbi:Glycosylphosphatidylinositol (GPI) anchor assembly protein [Neonectria magnoliae]|uniref:Glycosylphosphatidylinositol (GPI) anchor assembly protein n=1 Tax=Neonectria magnoliae TaxID=2732573 RepID=A0ABR1IDQ8_9HYPO
MSTTLTKGASAQPPATKAAIPAVPLLHSSVAASVSIGHPVLLATLFAWRFDALVADPVSTLFTALPVVAAIQAAYVRLCLPVAGSQGAKTAKKLRPGEKKKDATGPNRFATTVIALLLTLMVTPILHLLFILFGAPFVTHIAHTFLCCAHFAVLTVFPILYVRGSDPQALHAVLGASAPVDQTFGGLAGATVGAWLGAVPIPLDWDREWQKWPITIVVGAYLGYIFGSEVLGTVFYGKRWATPGPKEE